MQRNAVILLLVLLCVAFLVSCGKKKTAESAQGELVRTETGGFVPRFFQITEVFTLIAHTW